MLDGKDYYIHHGDCIPYLNQMESKSVAFSAFSPPFPSVFSYQSSQADIGNSEELKSEVPLHFSFFFRAMLRVMMAGRVMAVHCTQIARQKSCGEVGLYDFRGLLIRIAQRAGFVYEYDWLIRKNPQAQAIRTRRIELKFQGLESDRAKSRGTLCDYVIKFRAPGENKIPITSEGEVSRNDWIEWAEGAWSDIRETDTLNVRAGRGEDDCRHICALQLPLVRRLVRLYSNPGELVFSPFAGIATEVYCALELNRRGLGCELKDEYYQEAIKNCERAIAARASNKVAMLPFATT